MIDINENVIFKDGTKPMIYEVAEFHSNGASFTLYKEPCHQQKHVEIAKRHIKDRRDAVRFIVVNVDVDAISKIAQSDHPAWIEYKSFFSHLIDPKCEATLIDFNTWYEDNKHYYS
jgi:hypothetical protein